METARGGEDICCLRTAAAVSAALRQQGLITYLLLDPSVDIPPAGGFSHLEKTWKIHTTKVGDIRTRPEHSHLLPHLLAHVVTWLEVMHLGLCEEMITKIITSPFGLLVEVYLQEVFLSSVGNSGFSSFQTVTGSTDKL